MSDTDTNPEPEVSELSVEERLAQKFGAKEDDDAPEEDNAESEDDAQDEEPAEVEAEPEDTAEEVEYEGKAYKVPKEIKEALLRQTDYTKKTQEVAVHRRQVEDKAMFIAAKEQLMNAVSEELADMKSAEKQLQAYAGVDWQSLHANDPAQAFAHSQKHQELKARVQELRQGLGQKAQHALAITQQHRDKQWTEAAKGAYESLGKIAKDDDDLLTREVFSAAASADEAKTRFADPQTLIWAFKAAKWDALQKSKPAINKKAAEARPMKVASRSAPQTQRDGRILQAREHLRKTGSAASAEAVLEAMFSRRK